jgi:subtilase family serine protease
MAQNPATGNAVPFRLPDRGATIPEAIDRGPLAKQSPGTPISVTLALRLRNVDEAETLLVALHTPGDPQFHHFLTADQFGARFAPHDAEVARVVSALEKYGLVVQRTTTTTLKVTGLPSQMEQAFNVTLDSYEVPAHEGALAYKYHAPLSHPTIPPEIAPAVVALAGLDSRPALHPASIHSAHSRPASAIAAGTSQGNQPGFWTVTDFANYYDVQPLYKRLLTGKGRTLGIVTLANFTPSDVFTYWSSVGLTVDPNRLQVVNIDGGPGGPSDASRSLETALDVEQSGGIAPGAKIIVYQAPDTDQGWVDAFATAVESNFAETLSTSWGDWEWFENLENGSVTDPVTEQTVSAIQALHELFLRAAIQGQTLFAASGDYGAYEVRLYLAGRHLHRTVVMGDITDLRPRRLRRVIEVLIAK